MFLFSEKACASCYRTENWYDCFIGLVEWCSSVWNELLPQWIMLYYYFLLSYYYFLLLYFYFCTENVVHITNIPEPITASLATNIFRDIEHYNLAI